MTPFQWIFCSTLGVLAALELWGFFRARESARLVRVVVWTAAAVAIADPDRITQLANALGIGRGADVVLYVFVLAFIALSFVFYARQVRLERRIDTLVTRIAQLQPRRGSAAPEGPRDATP